MLNSAAGGIVTRVLNFSVEGYPPAKAEARSMLGVGHPHRDRVFSLLSAARTAAAGSEFTPKLTEPLGLELVIFGPTEPPSDATNYLGGVGDVLEGKSHRSGLDHLADLVPVALYANDRQIQEIHYRREQAADQRYTIRLWVLESPAPSE